MSIMLRKAIIAAVLTAGGCGVALASEFQVGERYGFGEAASESDIAAIDIDVMPDGRGAPEGSGTSAQGEDVYMQQCVACHGPDLQGVDGTGGTALIGGRGSLDSGEPKKTVESYWPYASTFFDYVKRAMPFDAPGSLSDDEVYAVVAYVLAEGDVIDEDTTVGPHNIGDIEMPNRDGFIRCDQEPCRPDVFNYR
ncbi:MAG: c-type cytochrome [Arhodomonas sp.]|nr:c-type cytochrome [Arhodomonas sp.]